MKKKLLIISNANLTFGARYHINQVIKSLGKNLFDIEILLNNDYKFFNNEFIKKIFLKNTSPLINSIYLQIYIPFYCLFNKINLIYCPWGIAPIIFHGKIIVGAHNPGPIGLNKFSSPKKIFFNTMYFLSLKRANLIKSPSNSFRRFLGKKFFIPLQKIITIHHGVDVEFWKSSISNVGSHPATASLKFDYFIFWSWFHETKNIERMLISYGRYCSASKVDQFKLLLAGRFTSKSYEMKIKKLIFELGISDNVNFLIDPNEIELSTAINNSSGIFLPFEYETFGFPYVEARIFNKPIAIARNLVSEEVSENQCHYFDPHSIHGMADAFHFLEKNAHISFEYKISTSFFAQSEVKGLRSMFIKELGVA